MTHNTDDASVGTALTDQQATDLHATPGRGARHEPGAGEDTGEGADALEPDATHDRLGNDKDQQDEGGTRRI